MEMGNPEHKTSADNKGYSLVSGGLIESANNIFRKLTRPGNKLTVTALALKDINLFPGD